MTDKKEPAVKKTAENETPDTSNPSFLRKDVPARWKLTEWASRMWRWDNDDKDQDPKS